MSPPVLLVGEDPGENDDGGLEGDQEDYGGDYGYGLPPLLAP